MLSQKLDYIAQLLTEVGITRWVVSPGSRNAPIVAALLRNGHELHSLPDERSAAFAALGMAQANQFPAAFLCTSGSALVNAFPAVVEAYYQRIPLLIVSADRPEELIDQWDGQTLRQPGIFGTYSRHAHHCNPRKTDFAELKEGLYSFFTEAFIDIPGPIHLNIALSEPIYEGISENATHFEVPPFVFKSVKQPEVTIDSVAQQLNGFSKIAVLVGQNPPSDTLSSVLSQLENTVPVFSDVCSSQQNYGLKGWDFALLKRDIPADLAPDLLITLGTVTLSKPLKNFLKKHKPKHLHLSAFDEIGDPFETVPTLIPCFEADFLQGVVECLNEQNSPEHQHFLSKWNLFLGNQTLKPQDLSEPFASELTWMNALFQKLNGDHLVHLGNSMSVRYGSWSTPTQAQIYSNRGVSGIDGCLSTAVGSAWANPDKTVIVIVGDVTAVYDSNAFWTNLPPNLRVVIFNNAGGRIFDWIEGPNSYKPLREFIHTPRKFNFQHLAAQFEIKHASYRILEIESSIQDLFFAKNAKLIELISQ